LSTMTLRLPKQVESDPRGPQVIRLLTKHTQLLWQGGDLEVPSVAFSPELAAALSSARSAGRVARGLENVEQRLANEELGLNMADRKSSVQRGVRVSRLLILSNDGAERFYRNVESLLRKHGPRVLAIRLDIGAAELGELIFGPGRVARLLMLEHKDAVAAFLLAMSGQEENFGDPL
jgi:hypothetical protein